MRQSLNPLASVHTALDDPQLARFQRDLIRRIGEQRTSMVSIDVAELTVVGIQPDVALTMVELGLTADPAHTAFDLQDAWTTPHLGRALPVWVDQSSASPSGTVNEEHRCSSAPSWICCGSGPTGIHGSLDQTPVVL
jgi:rsbT antagonist protein RsbS